MNSLAGHLLIAAPEMMDDYFSGTVVLVFLHSDDGAAGVILNKPSDVRIDSVWSDLDEQHPHSAERINIGGPCGCSLLAVHNSLAHAEMPVIPGVAVSFGLDELRTLVRQSHQTVRLFSGYAGWAPQQLEQEIELGGWYTLPARPSFVFDEPADLWRQACASYGHDIIRPIAGHHQPADPSLN